MVSTREKESFKKLVKFIGIVTLGYLAFLQIAVLIHLFSIKEKTISHGVSKEDAPIPAFTVCARTNGLTRRNILKKYNVNVLLLDQDPDTPFPDTMSSFVKRHWKNFDWGSVSLKQLYDEAVIYPHEVIITCEIGDDYNCTQNEDVYHLWEHVLKRSYSCSTLRIKKKVPYGEYLRVNMQFEMFKQPPFHVQVQDSSKSVPRYGRRNLHHYHDNYHTMFQGNVEQNMFTYTVEKVERLSENEGQSCSEDPTIDRVKCEDDCFEKQLLQDDSSCVLPWVMSPGRQCSNIDEALAMVKKEKEQLKNECDCQDSCMGFRYIFDKGGFIHTPSSGNEAVIDNRNGITLLKESYMYTTIDLLANVAGSVGIFTSMSLLLLLNAVIKTICNLQCCSEFLSSSFRENHVKHLLRASFLACLSLFLYEGSQLISKYLENPKRLTVDRLDPSQAPVPNVVLCNYARDYSKLPYILPSDYSQSLGSSPIDYMIECHLDNELCMEDGPLFSWETLYLTDMVCSMLRFDGGQYKELDILFNSHFQQFELFLTSWNTIPRYSTGITILNLLTVTRTVVTTITYHSEQKFNLLPCTENYLQCRERCFEQAFVNEDVCSPPEMPPTVKNQPCANKEELNVLLSYLYEKQQYTHLCQCGQQCSDLVTDLSVSNNFYSGDGSKLHVSLIPHVYTRISEEWAYPFNSLLAGIGGILGVLTGLSFLSVLLDSFLLILECRRKWYGDIPLAKHVWKIVVYFTISGCFLQQVYTNLSRYIESPVQLNEEIDNQSSLMILPHFTLCDLSDKFFLWSDYVIAFNPYETVVLTPDTIKDLAWSTSWFHLEDYLTDCTVFGYPCTQKKGEIHEWHDVPNVNAYCSRLEIKPLKFQHYIDNKVIFKTSVFMRAYVSNKEERRMFNLPKSFDIYEDFLTSTSSIYSLFLSEYELLEEKPNNCNSRLDYNTRNCLDQCILKHVEETLKCRFPWVEIPLSSLPICIDYSEYNYLFSINSTFLAGCRCLPQCHYTNYDLTYERYELSTTYGEGINKIEVSDSKRIFRERWAYTTSQFLADLGGLMSFFTGLTLYNIIFSNIFLLRF